jgi:hypothetical protein
MNRHILTAMKTFAEVLDSADELGGAGHDLRIVFEFVKHNRQEAILLGAVGTHDDVY